MNKIEIVLLIVFILIIVFLAFFFGLGEYFRQNYTLRELKDINTKRGSFSLTTTPSRIDYFEPTIKSLVRQNPKTIYLNVPYVFKKTGERYNIPKWLNKYTKTGQVTLIRPEDKGPATKFMGLLEYREHSEGIDSEEYICVVDDDQIYNKYLLSNMIKKADEFQGARVISVHIDLAPPRLQGWTGYIFKKKLLNNIINYPATNECFSVDDPWITSYFMDNNIEITRLFKNNVYNISITETPNDVIEFYRNLFTSLAVGYNSKNALYKERKVDEDLKCVKSLNSPEKIFQHNIKIIKTIDNFVAFL